MKNAKIKKLAECAILIAMSTVLSMITIWKMPFGGSVTPLSMLPVALVAIRYGLGWGFGASFVYAAVQMFLDLGPMMGWGMTPVMWFGAIFFDYFLAFTLLAVAGLWRKKGTPGILAGITLALFLRFACHYVSGVIFFGTWAWEGWNIYLYSLAYNGSYMLPELIFTLAGAFLLAKTPYMKQLVGAKG